MDTTEKMALNWMFKQKDAITKGGWNWPKIMCDDDRI